MFNITPGISFLLAQPLASYIPQQPTITCHIAELSNAIYVQHDVSSEYPDTLRSSPAGRIALASIGDFPLLLAPALCLCLLESNIFLAM